MKPFVLVVLLFGIISSCTKSESIPGLGAVTVVHAALDLSALKVNASGKTPNYAAIPSVNVTNFASSKHYAMQQGERSLEVVASADTTKTLFDEVKTFTSGKLSTLFIFGKDPDIDIVYNESEVLPTHTDTVIGIRFINLSPNSPDLDITLSTSFDVKEVKGLGYKKQTSFKTYPATLLDVPIVFQCWNASTGELLGSYSLPVAPVPTYNTVSIGNSRFKNITLVIKGLVGTASGDNAFGIFPVPHY